MRVLSGLTAIVTGAASGFGRQYAMALAKAGFNVSAADLRPEVATVANACRARGVAASAHVADVSNPQDVRRVVDATLREFGRIDILINNAGSAITSLPADDLNKSLTDYERTIGANLKGAFMLGRAVLPHMIAQRGGHIINIVCDHVHTPPGRPTGAEAGNMDLYDAACWGILGLTVTWAKEGKDHNVRVNSLCVGGVCTGTSGGGPYAEHTARDCGAKLGPEAVCELAIQLINEGPNGRTGVNIGVWSGESCPI